MASRPWRIELNRHIPKRLLTLGKAVAQQVRNMLETLQGSPQKGKLLKGYKDVRSLPLTTSSGEFRVIYRLIPKDRVILVYLIEPREKVYKLLQRRLR